MTKNQMYHFFPEHDVYFFFTKLPRHIDNRLHIVLYFAPAVPEFLSYGPMCTFVVLVTEMTLRKQDRVHTAVTFLKFSVHCLLLFEIVSRYKIYRPSSV